MTHTGTGNRKHLGYLAVFTAAVLAVAAPAQGAFMHWRGAGTMGNTATDPADPTTLFSEATNWFEGIVPGSGDRAVLAFTNPGYCNATNRTVHSVEISGMSDVGALHIAPGVALNVRRTSWVGSADMGRLVQTGGTHYVYQSGYDSNLILGDSAGARGTYEISGGLVRVRVHSRDETAALTVGNAGLGHFVQAGGTVQVDATYYDNYYSYARLYVGREAGSQGTYELSSGDLNVASTRGGCTRAYVGLAGQGTFVQTGGTATIADQILVGHDAGSTGTYELHDGSLVVQRQNSYVGYKGAGSFLQTGGIHQTPKLYVGSSSGTGAYQLDGGELSVSSGVDVGANGLFAMTGGVMSAGGSFSQVGTGNVLSITGGTATIGGTLSHTGAAGSLILSGAPVDVGGNLTHTGTGGALTVSASTVNVGGSLTHTGANGSVTIDSGTVQVNSNLSVDPTGLLTQTGGTTTVGQELTGPVHLSGTGSISSFRTRVSHAGGMTFTHDGGSHSPLELRVGEAAGQSGTYHLAGGQLSVGGASIGDSGTGTVHQTGGTQTVFGAMRLGRFAGGHGTMELDGGSLTAFSLWVGAFDGAGTLRITNPAAYLAVQNDLILGAHGTLEAVPGATIHMVGSAVGNESQDEAALAGLENVELLFEGGAGHWSTLELAGLDQGFVPEGFVGNFVLGSLTVGGAQAADLRLLDDFDNGNRSSPECLYVHNLTVAAGSTLDLNNLNVYVDGTFVNQGTILNGYPIPEPATVALLGMGAGLGLLRLGRRRQRGSRAYEN